MMSYLNTRESMMHSVTECLIMLTLNRLSRKSIILTLNLKVSKTESPIMPSNWSGNHTISPQDTTQTQWQNTNGSQDACFWKLLLVSPVWLVECVDIWEVSELWIETTDGFITLLKKLIMKGSIWSSFWTWENQVLFKEQWSLDFKGSSWTHFS